MKKVICLFFSVLFLSSCSSNEKAEHILVGQVLELATNVLQLNQQVVLLKRQVVFKEVNSLQSISSSIEIGNLERKLLNVERNYFVLMSDVYGNAVDLNSIHNKIAQIDRNLEENRRSSISSYEELSDKIASMKGVGSTNIVANSVSGNAIAAYRIDVTLKCYSDKRAKILKSTFANSSIVNLLEPSFC